MNDRFHIFDKIPLQVQRIHTFRPCFGKGLVRRLQMSCPLRADLSHLAAYSYGEFAAPTLCKAAKRDLRAFYFALTVMCEMLRE